MSSTIVDPAILVRRTGPRYQAAVVATVLRRGNPEFVPTAGSRADYIIHEKILKPLPSDTHTFFDEALSGMDPHDLSFPEVLKLHRRPPGAIPIIIDSSAFETANSSAEKLDRTAKVRDLHATLYPYQTQGVFWMRGCLNATGGLILADEMGLGKTIQIISLLLLDRPTAESPALIVCPTSLIANWLLELGKFAPILSTTVHRGQDRPTLYRDLKRTDVVITTYDTLVADISIMRSVDWSFLIADEAQAIKNPNSMRRQAIVQPHRRRTVAVTGTPVENSLLDLWSLADFAIPGILGDKSEFERNYLNGSGDVRRLRNVIEPIILRRRIADVATDLPARIDSDIPIELGEDLALQYERVRSDVVARYRFAGPLVATGQLQLFCAHPWLQSESGFDDNWEDAVVLAADRPGPLMTPKMERAVELISEAFAVGRKVLIFSIFNRVGPMIREAADDLPKAFWNYINGSTEQSRRQEIVDEFSAHNGPAVLVLNPKAAGTGLNITAATVVIHYTQVWNPATEAQASARAHRRGQNRPVNVYRLYYEKTVERVMLDRTLWKQELANDAIPVSSRDREDFSLALSISPRTGAT